MPKWVSPLLTRYNNAGIQVVTIIITVQMPMIIPDRERAVLTLWASKILWEITIVFAIFIYWFRACTGSRFAAFLAG